MASSCITRKSGGKNLGYQSRIAGGKILHWKGHFLPYRVSFVVGSLPVHVGFNSISECISLQKLFLKYCFAFDIFTFQGISCSIYGLSLVLVFTFPFINHVYVIVLLFFHCYDLWDCDLFHRS